MKKFNKIFTMVMVMVLMVLAPACKTVDPDPIEQDDASFVKVERTVTPLDNIIYIVDITFTFSVRTYAPTRLEGDVTVGNFSYSIGIDVPNTNGQSRDVFHTEKGINFKVGTYAASGYVNLLSTGKRIDIPATQIIIP